MELFQQLVLVALLVVANAAFAGTEVALLTLRQPQLDRLAGHGRAGRVLGRLASDPNRFLAAIQLGITLAGFLASATAAVTLAEQLVGPLEALGAFAEPVALVVVTTLMSFFVLVLGELAPKRIALERAERWALVAARPLSGFASVTRPAVWLLSRATDVAVRLAGVDPASSRAVMTREELQELILGHPRMTRDQRQIVAGALDFADRTLRQILIPRTEVVAVPEHLGIDEAARELVLGGHSRAPVYRARLDDADRSVSLVDLVGGAGTVADVAMPATVLPETLPVIDALRVLQAAGQRMALVVSEHGGVEGLVTAEDIVEEIVGEIHDERDRDVLTARHLPDGGVRVPGRFPIHDLPDLGIRHLDAGDSKYSTIAGLVLDRLGRLPRAGEEVEVGDYRLTVEQVGDRRVRQVTIRRGRSRSSPR